MSTTRSNQAHEFALKIMDDEKIDLQSLSNEDKRKEIAKAAFDMVDAMEKESMKRYSYNIGYMGPYG